MPAAASDGWVSPGGPTRPPTDPQPAPAGPALPADPGAPGFDPSATGLEPGFDPDHNWGVAGPSPAAPATTAPTAPPTRRRPRALVVALVLTYLGVGLSVAELAGILWAVGTEVGEEGAALGLGATFDLWLLGLAWLMLAVGAVAAGVLAGRGLGGARVTLVGLLGVIALIRLCSAGLAAAPRRTGAPDVEFVDLGVPGTLVALVLGGLALAAAVLLVTPGVREHFSQVSRS